MSQVAFRDLQLNDQPPVLNRSDGATLSATGGVYFVPTAVHDDAFAFVPPKGPAKTYLLLASILDGAISIYNVQILNWGNLSEAARKSAEAALAAALAQNASLFRAQSWPSASRPLVVLLEEHLRILQTDAQKWRTSGLSLTSAAYATLRADEDNSSAVDRLRNSLGLPPP
jgi:hypothetical protein